MLLRKVVFRQIKKQLRAVAVKLLLPHSHSSQASRSVNLPIFLKTHNSRMKFMFSTQEELKQKKKEIAESRRLFILVNSLKEVPIGITDFLVLKDMMGYFDKTLFIPKQTLGRKVLRLSLYRRGGKTSTLSMISHCYFWQSILRKLFKKEYEKLQNLLLDVAQLEKKLKIQKFSSPFKEIISYFYSQSRISLLQKQISSLKDEIDKLKNELQLKEKSAKQKYNFDKIFEGKKIKESPVIDIGLHPTIYIQLSVPLKNVTYQQVFNKFMYSISQTCRKHNYLLGQLQLNLLKTNNAKEKKKLQYQISKFQLLLNYQKIEQNDPKSIQLFDKWLLDENLFKSSISFLCELLKDYWGEQSIILIDEYDRAFLYALQHPQKQKILNLLDKFYQKTLKTNDQSFFQAIIMGILPIKYSNYESNFNNYLQLNAASNSISFPFFGFTHSQVKQKLTILLQFRKEEFKDNFNQIIEDQMKILKNWASGYWISGFELYNPWTIVNCLRTIILSKTLPCRQFQNTWVSTGNMQIIRKIISQSKSCEQQILKFMTNQFSHYEQNISYQPLINADQIFKPSSLFYFLFHTGYLTKDKNCPNYYVVPNEEIFRYFFEELFISLMEKYFPDYKDSKIKKQIWNAGKDICSNLENCQVFTQLLEQLLNRIIKIDLNHFISVYDKQTVAEKISFFERCIKISFSAAQRHSELEDNYRGYHTKFEAVPFDEKTIIYNKMDRFIFSQYSNEVIIHEDKIIQKSNDFDNKKIEALMEIFENSYLKNVQKTYLNAIQNLKKNRGKTITQQNLKKLEYVQIAAIIICQPERKNPCRETNQGQLDVNIENSQNTQYRVHVQSESYTFPLENLPKLLEEYQFEWKLNSKTKKNDSQITKWKENFRKMLRKYNKQPETM